ncbi:hypothetical protein SNE510_64300 [Streptomyces sp. NE5-10]|nr:hypothetical protein SNE510_64300 [Streptomyces sp. NE5-10]
MIASKIEAWPEPPLADTKTTGSQVAPGVEDTNDKGGGPDANQKAV